MENLLFYLGLSALLAHELDAVAHREWRLLYGLRRLREPVATQVFVLGHVPLLVAILWAVFSPDDSIRWSARFGLDGFLILHAFLHWRLRKNPLHTFCGPASLLLIYGGAAAGLAHLGTTLTH